MAKHRLNLPKHTFLPRFTVEECSATGLPSPLPNLPYIFPEAANPETAENRGNKNSTRTEGWEILARFGRGTFSDIYAGRDIRTGKLVAIKVERAEISKSVLGPESEALLRVQRSCRACRFIHYMECRYKSGIIVPNTRAWQSYLIKRNRHIQTAAYEGTCKDANRAKGDRRVGRRSAKRERKSVDVYSKEKAMAKERKAETKGGKVPRQEEATRLSQQLNVETDRMENSTTDDALPYKKEQKRNKKSKTILNDEQKKIRKCIRTNVGKNIKKERGSAGAQGFCRNSVHTSVDKSEKRERNSIVRNGKGERRSRGTKGNRDRISRKNRMARGQILRVLVMSLVGPNVSQLRKAQFGGHFCLRVSLVLMMQMMEAVRDVHMAGFVHRDIKPSNFCCGPIPTNILQSAVDFHIEKFFLKNENCRKSGRSNIESSTSSFSDASTSTTNTHMRKRALVPTPPVSSISVGLPPVADTHTNDQETGLPKAERKGIKFRGTRLYASAHAHSQRDLGRRDDMWSLFYSFMVLLKGRSLPWFPESNDHQGKESNARVGQLKKEYNERPADLLQPKDIAGFELSKLQRRIWRHAQLMARADVICTAIQNTEQVQSSLVKSVVHNTMSSIREIRSATLNSNGVVTTLLSSKFLLNPKGFVFTARNLRDITKAAISKDDVDVNVTSSVADEERREVERALVGILTRCEHDSKTSQPDDTHDNDGKSTAQKRGTQKARGDCQSDQSSMMPMISCVAAVNSALEVTAMVATAFIDAARNHARKDESTHLYLPRNYDENNVRTDAKMRRASSTRSSLAPAWFNAAVLAAIKTVDKCFCRTEDQHPSIASSSTLSSSSSTSGSDVAALVRTGGKQRPCSHKRNYAESEIAPAIYLQTTINPMRTINERANGNNQTTKSAVGTAATRTRTRRRTKRGRRDKTEPEHEGSRIRSSSPDSTEVVTWYATAMVRRCILQIHSHFHSLEFEDEPDYSACNSLLMEALIVTSASIAITAGAHAAVQGAVQGITQNLDEKINGNARWKGQDKSRPKTRSSARQENGLELNMSYSGGTDETVHCVREDAWRIGQNDDRGKKGKKQGSKVLIKLLSRETKSGKRVDHTGFNQIRFEREQEWDVERCNDKDLDLSSNGREYEDRMYNNREKKVLKELETGEMIQDRDANGTIQDEMMFEEENGYVARGNLKRGERESTGPEDGCSAWHGQNEGRISQIIKKRQRKDETLHGSHPKRQRNKISSQRQPHGKGDKSSHQQHGHENEQRNDFVEASAHKFAVLLFTALLDGYSYAPCSPNLLLEWRLTHRAPVSAPLLRTNSNGSSKRSYRRSSRELDKSIRRDAKRRRQSSSRAQMSVGSDGVLNAASAEHSAWLSPASASMTKDKAFSRNELFSKSREDLHDAHGTPLQKECLGGERPHAAPAPEAAVETTVVDTLEGQETGRYKSRATFEGFSNNATTSMTLLSPQATLSGASSTFLEKTKASQDCRSIGAAVGTDTGEAEQKIVEIGQEANGYCSRLEIQFASFEAELEQRRVAVDDREGERGGIEIGESFFSFKDEKKEAEAFVRLSQIALHLFDGIRSTTAGITFRGRLIAALQRLKQMNDRHDGFIMVQDELLTERCLQMDEALDRVLSRITILMKGKNVVESC